MGMKRLSIIDLENCVQPMSNEDGTIRIPFYQIHCIYIPRIEQWIIVWNWDMLLQD